MTPDFVQFIPLIVLTILTGIPCWIILTKIGFSRWWLLFLVLTLFGAIIIMWVIACRRWPAKTDV